MSITILIIIVTIIQVTILYYKYKHNLIIMLITIKRIYTCNDYTIGHLYIDGTYICDTLEDTDRMLDQSMSESYILSKKKKNLTAIPT